MKKPLKTILLVAAAVLLAAFALATNGLSAGAKVPINGIDLAAMDNGAYIGEYSYKRWANTLRVHVDNGAITGIEIIKDVFGANITHCSDETFRRVIQAQDTRIDAVSGATVTTKAYLKAIENALQP
ncbi:MAG: FMN-binding protein [Eubacteriaceae bacterium]|nr:FMN-binding protein [Eubacteriaceae bacterium]